MRNTETQTKKVVKQKMEFTREDLTSAFLRGLYMGDILCRYETDTELDISYKQSLYTKIENMADSRQAILDILQLPRELFIYLALEVHDEYTKNNISSSKVKQKAKKSLTK